MTDTLLAPFLGWAQTKGISTPLELVSTDQRYRSMRIPSSMTTQEFLDQQQNAKSALSSSSSAAASLDLVRVPLDACIVGEDMPTLIEKLLYERKKGSSSEYQPWLDLLPTLDDFQDMPRFWTDERLDFVTRYDGGQLSSRLDIDTLKKQQGTITNQNEDNALLLLPWAQAIVDSRTNYLPDETYSLTPMLDFFNHDASYTTSARVEDTAAAATATADSSKNVLTLAVNSDSILASSAASATTGNVDWKEQFLGFFDNQKKKKQDDTGGDEVFISYGDFDNIELLSNYGFCTEENSSNIEQFKVRSLGMSVPAILVVDSNGEILESMFNAMSLESLRSSVAIPSDFEKQDQQDPQDQSGDDTLSARNEVEMVALVAGELEEALYDASVGATKAMTEFETPDVLVATYLKGRIRTLQKGVQILKTKYPEVF